MIRMILVEDHQLVRNGVKFLLGKESDIAIVGEYSSGKEAIAGLSEGMEADVVFVDIKMPDMDGIVLSQILRNDYPHLKVVILSLMNHERYLVEAFNSGAKGYLLKNVSAEEMIFAVRHVSDGHAYICSELGIKLFKKVADFTLEEVSKPKLNMELSSKELEVLKLTAEGYTNGEAAEKLAMSKRTIEGMRKSLIEKTATKNTGRIDSVFF